MQNKKVVLIKLNIVGSFITICLLYSSWLFCYCQYNYDNLTKAQWSSFF